MTEERVTFLCPNCSQQVETVSDAATCEACDAQINLTAAPTGTAQMASCVVCKSEALYVAKDFNKNFGVIIVLLGCAGFYWGAATGIASLVALTFVDRIVYYRRPMVTVCYACKSVYRGPINPALAPYDLTFDETFEGTGEKPAFTGGRATADASEAS
jgi:hypothetical protein